MASLEYDVYKFEDYKQFADNDSNKTNLVSYPEYQNLVSPQWVKMVKNQKHMKITIMLFLKFHGVKVIKLLIIKNISKTLTTLIQTGLKMDLYGIYAQQKKLRKTY